MIEIAPTKTNPTNAIELNSSPAATINRNAKKIERVDVVITLNEPKR